VAVLLFYTDYDRGDLKGFRINYKVSMVGSNHTTRNVIASSTPSQIVNYPESGLYTNNELSTLVYSPGFSFNPSVNVRSTFTVRGMENCCDYVYAYSFVLGNNSVPLWNLEAV